MGNEGIERIDKLIESRFGNRKHQKLSFSINAVDQLVDEILIDYQNHGYKKWYYKVVYEFGIENVLEWRRRASEGNEPSKLFTKYVNDARKYKKAKRYDI
jgi:hypothetical protein